MWNVMWQIIIGPGGAVMFSLALILLALSTILREAVVPRSGTTDRLSTSRPIIHSAIVGALALGIAATAVRMGTMS